MLLHIGLAKTGTTSIQGAVSRASREGRLGPVGYPDFRGLGSNFVAALYLPFDRLPRMYRSRYAAGEDREALAGDVARFREELADVVRTHDRIILSAEALGTFRRREVEALREDLHTWGVDDVAVVVYLRDPASYYLSLAQQRIKASATFPSPVRWKSGFMGVLEVWGSVFPDLVVRAFVESRLRDGDVVADFRAVASEHLGVDLEGLEALPRTRNESLSAEALLVLQRYRERFYPDEDNVFKRDSTRLRTILAGSEDHIPQTPLRLRKEVAEMVMRRHRTDLVRLREQYGVDLGDGLAAGEPDDGGGDLPEPDGPWQLTDVLASYDEATVERLLWHCLRQALVDGEDR